MKTPVVWFYTRRECTLCDTARAAMELAVRREGLKIEIHDVDIDQHPDLRARFTNDVPVVMLGGIEIARHRVDPVAFALAIRESVAAAAQAPIVAQQPPGESAGVSLAAEKCEPCQGGIPPLNADAIAPLLSSLDPGWNVERDHHLRREVAFPDFATALAFTNRIGAIAEEQGHHPDIELGWGRVVVTVWTHKIDGLTRADFVLAAKIDVALLGSRSSADQCPAAEL